MDCSIALRLDSLCQHSCASHVRWPVIVLYARFVMHAHVSGHAGVSNCFKAKTQLRESPMRWYRPILVGALRYFSKI